MSKPLISIIVPIYKVEPYLRRCLNSIVNQTYTNLEIILVDDGSPDNCPQICDEYAAKDNRIIVIHKENGGLSDARNAGLDICKGEYVSFIDSDDYVDSNYIESLIEPTKKDSYDFIIADYLSSNEEIEPSHLSCKEGPIQSSLTIISIYCNQQYPPSAWAKLYKRSFLDSNKFRFQKGLLFEDQLWSCTLACFAKNIYIIHKQIYHYTIRTDSIMQSSDIGFSKRLSSWCFILTQEENILSSYQESLKKEISSFFTIKITEALNTANRNRLQFHKAFQAITQSMNKKIISHWIHQAKGLYKFYFFTLSLLPSKLQEEIMYFHLRNRA